jgi:hypothetical protein
MGISLFIRLSPNSCEFLNRALVWNIISFSSSRECQSPEEYPSVSVTVGRLHWFHTWPAISPWEILDVTFVKIQATILGLLHCPHTRRYSTLKLGFVDRVRASDLVVGGGANCCRPVSLVNENPPF